MRRSIFKQNKRIRLKRKKIIIKASVIAGLVLFLVVVAVWGSYNENVRIVNVYIEGNDVVLDKKIKALIDEQIRGKYFYIIPKNNIFIYPKNSIKNKILETFKRIYYVKISISDFTSIVVTVKERKPYAVWCGENPNKDKENNKNECYFIDSDGFLFAKSPIFSGDVYFTVYGDIINFKDSNILGSVFLGKERFKKLMRLKDLLNKEGIKVYKLTQKENGDFQFYISSGGVLMFNELQDMEKLLRNLVSAIEVKKNENKNINKGLEYIDVRFNNKVIFKFTS